MRIPLLLAAQGGAAEGLGFGLLNLLLVLLAAWGAGQVADRLGYPSVLGELIAGILLGPPLLGLLAGGGGLRVIGNLGIILMMLYIGLEIDLDDLRRASWPGLLAATGGFVVPALLGYAVTVWFGGTVLAGAFVAIAVGVTSLATKSRILVDLGLLDTRIAYVLMAGALLSDTATLVLFAAIIGFVEAGGLDLVRTGQVALEVTVFFGAATVVGMAGLPRLGALVRRVAPQERLADFAFVVAVGLAYAEGAELAGLHAVLGAFVGGVFLRRSGLDTRQLREVDGLLHDVSVGFLAPVFFVMAGFEITFGVFRTDLGLLLAIVAVATLGKIVGTALFYLPTGYGLREGLVVGAAMNGRGAVEIIVAGIGLELGLISPELFTILVFMAIATTAMVPVLLKVGVEWLRSHGELDRSGQRRGVIVIGAGPVGRTLARSLDHTRPVTLVDRSPERCADARRQGLTAWHGDALDPTTLARAGAEGAGMLVALTPNSEINLLAAQVGREEFLIPQLIVAVRPTMTGSLTGLLDRMDAQPLLDAPVDLSLWDRWLSTGAAEPATWTVTGDGAELRRRLGAGRAELPLTVIRDDERLPFAAVDELSEGDRVHLLVRSTDRTRESVTATP